MTRNLALNVIEAALKKGLQEFCLCAGSRNAEFVKLLHDAKGVKVYHWFEERSAAFFALGRAKLTGRPVAVITTSGTAAAELLPAMIEGYYSGVPLLAITADRPRAYRQTGAPQTIEQVGLFGPYAVFSEDLADGEASHLRRWNLIAPAHINVCFEDPALSAEDELSFQGVANYPVQNAQIPENPVNQALLDQFFKLAAYPFAIVSALKAVDREAVAQFLIKVGMPCYLESTSGLREDPRLQYLRITRSEKLWGHAAQAGYPIDGVLRIGGVPTLRLWRDLEDRKNQVHACSLSDLQFSGLSWGVHIQAAIASFLNSSNLFLPNFEDKWEKWALADKRYAEAFQHLCEDEPLAEPSMFRAFSQRIPQCSRVYLGNSLPIREWDLGAVNTDRKITIEANRGVSGIDGQISTFLGWCLPKCPQYAILGDLTTLYDFAGPWVLNQLPDTCAQIIVVNNHGGKIFSRLYKEKAFQNSHQLSFQDFASFWSLSYTLWEEIPAAVECKQNALIELRPDEVATTRFWQKLQTI